MQEMGSNSSPVFLAIALLLALPALAYLRMISLFTIPVPTLVLSLAFALLSYNGVEAARLMPETTSLRVVSTTGLPDFYEVGRYKLRCHHSVITG